MNPLLGPRLSGDGSNPETIRQMLLRTGTMCGHGDFYILLSDWHENVKRSCRMLVCVTSTYLYPCLTHADGESLAFAPPRRV